MSNFANPEEDSYQRRIILASGSAAQPSIVFASDLSKGLYRDEDGNIVLSGTSGGGSGTEDYETEIVPRIDGVLVGGPDGNWTDVISHEFPAGDWDISATLSFSYDDGGVGDMRYCLSTTSGTNSLSGTPTADDGDLSFVGTSPRGDYTTTMSISPRRFHFTVPTTVYAKADVVAGSPGTALAFGRLSGTYVH